VTADPGAQDLGARHGFGWLTDGAADGHTGAVAAAARHLAKTGAVGMLTVPGDIPLVTTAEIAQLLDAHRPGPSFTIAPSHDELGSNAIVVSPPDAVPLRFGDNSFFPPLAAAEARGICPTVLHLPGIALDIDNPGDLGHFAQLGSRTRAGLWLANNMPALAAAIGRMGG
jgi:2-phospho-L-lactate guanylyltransferase